MSEPLLSAIVVSWNSLPDIGPCLTSIEQERQGQDCEVLVVDNGSSDGSADFVRAHFPQVRLLELGANRGYAAGVNAGIAVAKGRYLLLLNPDAELRPGAVAHLGAFAESHPSAAVVGCRLLGHDGSLQPSCRDFPNPFLDLLGVTELYRLGFVHSLLRGCVAAFDPHDRAREVDWLSGACLLLRRAALEDVGFMDEGYFLYAEEMDLCYRVRQKGWGVYFTPEAEVVHRGAGSTERLPGQQVVWQYASLYRFYALHKPGWQRLLLRQVVFWGTLPKVAWLALFGRSQRQRALRQAFWRVLRMNPKLVGPWSYR